MRQDIHVWMGEKEKRERVPATIWINETPPNCRRGKNRKMKSRHYKRQKMEQLNDLQEGPGALP